MDIFLHIRKFIFFYCSLGCEDIRYYKIKFEMKSYSNISSSCRPLFESMKAKVLKAFRNSKPLQL